MDEKYLRLFKATKVLVNHTDTEHVVDKAIQMGRGNLDIFRSEEFDDLVENAREVVTKAEDAKK